MKMVTVVLEVIVLVDWDLQQDAHVQGVGEGKNVKFLQQVLSF